MIANAVHQLNHSNASFVSKNNKETEMNRTYSKNKICIKKKSSNLI
jgi:hypothetical protein